MLTRFIFSRAASLLLGGALLTTSACSDPTAPLAPRPTVSLAKVTPSGPNALPQRGRIVFPMPSTAMFDDDLYSINEDGSGLARLTFTPTRSESYPAASRDGKKIAYVVKPLGLGQELVVMNADGSMAKTILKPGLEWWEMERMEWSPDGKRIAIGVRLGYTEWDIYLINPANGAATRVTSFPGEERSPTWSPDGSRIAFQMADPAGVMQVYSMTPDGSDITALSNCGVDCIEPAWSPDGVTVAMYIPEFDATSIMRVSDQTLIGSLDGRYATWAPDGARLVFNETGTFDLSTGSFNGTDVKPVTAVNNLIGRWPTWLRK